jgi:hypothetical protein
MNRNYFLQQYPPESHSWAGKVTFGFSYPHYGWIQFVITCDVHVQGVIIHCSNVYNPFPELARWLEAIASGDLPAEFVVFEEGPAKTLRAAPVNSDEFVFEILEGYWSEKEGKERPVYLYGKVSRKQFLCEFLKRWDDFLAHYYDPDHWENHGSKLRELDLSRVRETVNEWLSKNESGNE